MFGLYREYRTPAYTPLSCDIAKHLYTRMLCGPIVVVADNPRAMLSAVRKQWIKLQRTLTRERSVVIHGRPEQHPHAATAKSRERERRIAAREREQRRLRAEFEHAERVVERRPAVRRQPQVRYYRAGSRDTTFSDVWR